MNEYLDLQHEYRILVPQDKYAEELLYRGDIHDSQGIRTCFYKMIFHEDDFNYLEDRLFDFMNVKFDILINMYEEEILEADQVEDAIVLTKKIMSEINEEKFTILATELIKLFEKALENSTIVGFYF